MVAARRHHGEAGHDPRRDAPVIVALLGIAARADEEAALGLDHFEERLLVALIVGVALGALEQGVGLQRTRMQPRDVARIDAAFHRLQPVAFLPALGGEGLLRRHAGELPFRLGRPIGLVAHVRPQDVADLDQRVAGELHLLAEAALLRLGRDFDALAGDVVFPAVIGAAEAAFLVAPEPERHAAVGAELVDQAHPPGRNPGTRGAAPTGASP